MKLSSGLEIITANVLQIGGRFNAANVLLALVAFFFLSVDLETI
jgi:UDP-N-acetylmuramyl tripeptide synthase